MNKAFAWVTGHVWETVSAVLGAGLLVSVGFLVAGAGEPDEDPVVATTTTTLATTTIPAPTSTVPEGAPTTEPPEEEIPPGVTAVVVDNHPDARFQIGLAAADLLVETPVEAGLSRFTAFFAAQPPDLVGPVRSLRPVSADLLALFQPVVFTSGGQPFVTGAVSATGATIVTPDQSIAFQSLERPQPHNVFVSPSVDVPAGVEFPAPWESGDWPGGDPATEITLPISGGVGWRFEDGAYVRYQETEPFQIQSAVDAEPEPLTRDTLIVMVAHQKSAGYVDSAGLDVPTFDVIGGGDLYLLHNGEVIEGTWFRPSQAEEYTFTGEDDEVIPIPSGGLYWAIVPEGQPIDIGG
jgi:hypothetical protein